MGQNASVKGIKTYLHGKDFDAKHMDSFLASATNKSRDSKISLEKTSARKNNFMHEYGDYCLPTSLNPGPISLNIGQTRKIDAFLQDEED